MKDWYELVEMIDSLKTDKMESFVGNDPRALYNLVLHMLDSEVPHAVAQEFVTPELTSKAIVIESFLSTLWRDNQQRFRLSGPRQSLTRTILGLMLATGWYSVFAINSDDGSCTFIDVWNPAEVFPFWGYDGLVECAHIYNVSKEAATSMLRRCGWKVWRALPPTVKIRDYWEIKEDGIVYNTIAIGEEVVKNEEPTRFTKLPIYISPVGGLPDTGAIGAISSINSGLSMNKGSISSADRWKAEIGQSIVATNEHIYKAWNKWWTFSLQLLRDTAQAPILERSRSGKPIVRPENIFGRGQIWRGGPEDSVDFVSRPPIPIELRTTQLDLEAMMQRGGVNWSMYGSVSQRLTAYVMSQIAASANQIMKPFHQAYINLCSDIDNDLVTDWKERGIKPYNFSFPSGFSENFYITTHYEIEIPGDLINRITQAKMADPEFRLSYSTIMKKLFPEIKNPQQEWAQIEADKAKRHWVNSTIALIRHFEEQANLLIRTDPEASKLFTQAAQITRATLSAQPSTPQVPQAQGADFNLNNPATMPREFTPQAPIS
jgi:hypothetical protein